MTKHFFKYALAFAGFALTAVAQAQLSIEITGAGANRLPIAVADFSGERIVSQALTSVLRGDLERSAMPLAETTAVDFANMKTRGADTLVSGSVTPVAETGESRYETRFHLHDVLKQTTLGGQSYVSTAAQLRTAAHRTADFIYEKLIGEPGIFSTHIAYVVKTAGRYELQIADADAMLPPISRARIRRRPGHLTAKGLLWY